MRKRARLIYNPTSGREALAHDLVEILGIFEQAGYYSGGYDQRLCPGTADSAQ